ncbi:hypothetical protein ACFVFS_27265 [Kitasatospora sp. NPDC057692]|uniref:hypothetical protein n=1 Tax=Kitasatospora sp. NPDC057692 TaxID=3346215 RepID=UPI0036801C9C
MAAGRKPAGLALLDLLDDPKAPRLCVLSGPQGIGKSHLLTWLGEACGTPGGPPARRPDAAFSLAGMTTEAVVWRLAARLGVAARGPADLVRALGENPRPRLVLLRDLDRSAEPGAVAARILGCLPEVPDLRLVAEGADGVWEGDRAAAVLDLTRPEWTDPGLFALWYGRQRGPSPFEAADVYPSPGSALLALGVPAGVSGARSAGVHAAWWTAASGAARSALGVLAAAVQPLTPAQWSAAAGAEAAAAAARILPPDRADGTAWWLPPGPLRDAVTAEAPPADPVRLARTLTDTIPRLPDASPDLTRTDPDALGLAVRQAVLAGLAEEVLDDFELLTHADPVAVTAALATSADPVATAWRRAGPWLIDEPDPAVRARLLRSRGRLGARTGGTPMGQPLPTAVGAALDRLASGTGSPLEFLTALLDSDVLVCPDAATGAPLVTVGVNGREGLDACTSPDLVPSHWADTVPMAGRHLAAAFDGLDLRLDPASTTSLCFPLSDLGRVMEAARSQD